MTIFILSVALVVVLVAAVAVCRFYKERADTYRSAWEKETGLNDRLKAEYEAMEIDRDHWKHMATKPGRCVK